MQRSAPSIEVHTGDRALLRELFREADDSALAIAQYISRGTVLVAREAGSILGHVQMIGAGSEWELKSLAVRADRRGAGVGGRLVEAGVSHARERGAARVVVATAAADIALLRFYQRLGFRMSRIERDAFTPENGYPPGLRSDGIPVRDRVWLDLEP